MDMNTSCLKDTEQAPPAPKKGGSGRNSEKRRERSKVAARCRRSKESEIFSELAEFLPLPESTRNSLDKASVMRLSLSDLKLRHVMEKVFSDKANLKKCDGLDELDTEVLSMVNNAMGGFLFVMSTDGDIIYASDSIATHLGLSQVEVMGLSIYDFSHPCDHGDIKEMLAVNKKDGKDQDETATRSSTFRMKCTITARGRNVHLRAASYKVIEFTGRMFSGSEDSETQWFIGIGEPLLHPSDVDIPLNKQTFLTKHSPDMRCEFVDDSVMTFLGYQPDDLIGKSIFEFHHASDGPALARAFKSLYTKGQSVTERFRFLAKHGGWVWVITQATLIQPSNGSKPNSIVCLNFVTSGIENEDEIMSSVQEERSVFSPFKMALPEVKSMGQTVVTKRPEDNTPIKPYVAKETVLPEIIPDSKPIMSTKNVIAPRTEDMDSGFLMPCDDTLIVSKEEPEDLTHLAPIAGDGCVPLDMPIPLLDTLLKEMEEANVPFTFNDNYVEVNFDEVPQLEMPILSSSSMGPEPQQDSGEMCGKQSPSLPMNSPSPLFLNSDPPMVSSPGSKSSLLSPFQLSPNPCRTYRSNSDGCNSSISGSSYEFQASPNSVSGYEDSRSPPALVGLTLHEDTFQAALLMESQDDPEPSGKCSDYPRIKSSELDFQRSGSPSTYSGAYITLADGRKFPIQMPSSPEYMWPGQTLMNRNTADTDVMDTKVSPISPEGKINCISNRKNLCDFMELEPKPLIVANQSLITAPPNDAFDAVLKGGGGRQPWSWNSSAGSAVSKLENVSMNSEMPEKMMYKDTSSGPPLAKQPRMSPAVNGGRAGSSHPMEYCGYSDVRKQVGQLGGTVNSEPGMMPVNRKTPVQNRSPGVTGAKVPSNVQTMDQSESAIADLGIDLRSCLQKLLSTGRSDKVNEILRLLKETNCTNDDEEERAQSPGAGKGIGDAGGGPSFGLKPVQNILQANREPQRKLLLNNNRRVNNHGGLLSTLGNTSNLGRNNLLLPGLLELTRQDCEVNAPLNESSCLLSGAELLTALENDVIEDPFV